MIQSKEVLLHLSLIKGIGPGVVERIIQQLPTDFIVADLYSWSQKEFMRCGITSTTAENLVQGLANEKLLEHEQRLLERHGITIITQKDEQYPALLKETHLPPLVLYLKGNPVWMEMPTIAFVGARKANRYGKSAVTALVPELVHEGWVTVSGGAYGIDASVHQTTIECGGKTVVVLGSGLLKPYPLDHVKLFTSVVANGGALVSAFPLELEPLKGNFPARNRIISGMSKGTVVVQAAQKSGALITAQYALEQGRSVFAVPGPIDDPLSKGCNGLLKKGACLVDDACDILHEFGISADRQSVLFPVDDAVIDLLSLCKIPRTLDDIVQETGVNEQELTVTLFELQMQGVIEQNFAGLWQTL